MGILSIFKSRSDDGDNIECGRLTIDLSQFKIGDTQLGGAPYAGDPFAEAIGKGEDFRPAKSGFELASKGGLLDSVYIELDDVRGSLLHGGTPLAIDSSTDEQTIIQHFGEPYWIDRSDGEVILFYEYRNGTLELQFEFPHRERLEIVTISMNGVLSSAEDREAYGVDKPWPPQS